MAFLNGKKAGHSKDKNRWKWESRVIKTKIEGIRDMVEHIITSLENYLGFLDVYSEVDFFRGLSKEDYPLIPSIGRYYTEGEENVLVQFEKELFDDFKRKYAMFTDVRPKNDKELLFLAQHYGLPTRLLDWTYNPLIALCFACNKHFNQSGVVYHCLPFGYHLFDENKDDILSFPHLSILVPNITDVRYKNQNGLFTLYSRPWEDQMSEHVITKFVIPAGAKMNILNKLEKIGMTRSYIMPSLDSLSQEIVQIHHKRYVGRVK